MRILALIATLVLAHGAYAKDLTYAGYRITLPSGDAIIKVSDLEMTVNDCDIDIETQTMTGSCDGVSIEMDTPKTTIQTSTGNCSPNIIGPTKGMVILNIIGSCN